MDEILGVVNSKDLEHLYNRVLSQELEQLKSAISDRRTVNATWMTFRQQAETMLDLRPIRDRCDLCA